jgi:hypothetical protein
MAGILVIQGTAAGPKASWVPFLPGSHEGEAEPTRSEESSEEDCQEDVGLSISHRGRRMEADIALLASRLPAIKSQLAVANHFVIAPSPAEHACRNGLGAPLRC